MYYVCRRHSLLSLSTKILGKSALNRVFYSTWINNDRTTEIINLSNPKEFENHVKAPGPKAFVSAMNDPFVNLALENYIFKNMPEPQQSSEKEVPNKNTFNNNRLLMYINSACIVIGRNQNPWRECNLQLVNSLGIPVLRRRSGGGTVVHDPGNVNFSVMTAREDFTRDKHAEMIVDAINQLPSTVTKVLKPTLEDESLKDLNKEALMIEEDSIGGLPGMMSSDNALGSGVVEVPGPQIKLQVNERHDIVDKETGKKVSGSAYKIERQKAYHHGTMLLNSKLDVLSMLLHKDPEIHGTIEGRGVESVKSPVANLGMDSDVFIQVVLEAFCKKYAVDKSENTTLEKNTDEFVNPLTAGIDDIDVSSDPFTSADSLSIQKAPVPVVHVKKDILPEDVLEMARELRVWDWIYGQTPDFIHTFSHKFADPALEDVVFKFHVSKGFVKDFEVSEDAHKTIDVSVFDPLRTVIQQQPNKLRYIGSEIEGYVLHDELGNWLKDMIDGVGYA